MAKKVIQMTLNTQSINDTIKFLEDYKKDLMTKTQRFAERLAEEGVINAQAQIMSFPAIDSGQLLSSIEKEPGMVFTDGAEWYVYTGCPYAQFVEFGTGIIGEGSPHPNPVGWQYDVNNHGDKGWVYQKDGEWHWTQGRPAKPFMYNTVKELYIDINRIAREVFG